MRKAIIAHLFAHLVPRFGNKGALPAVAQRQGRLRLGPARGWAVLHAHEVWPGPCPWPGGCGTGPRALPQGPGGPTAPLPRYQHLADGGGAGPGTQIVSSNGGLGCHRCHPGPGPGAARTAGAHRTRRQALGLWPLVFFFLGLAAQLIRLGVLTGTALVVDSTLLQAWCRDDPDAAWVTYARRRAVWGSKVHMGGFAKSPSFLFLWPAPWPMSHDSVVGCCGLAW